MMFDEDFGFFFNKRRSTRQQNSRNFVFSTKNREKGHKDVKF